jgi:hypothetical protein
VDLTNGLSGHQVHISFGLANVALFEEAEHYMIRVLSILLNSIVQARSLSFTLSTAFASLSQQCGGSNRCSGWVPLPR